jgi:hypothetical protein
LNPGLLLKTVQQGIHPRSFAQVIIEGNVFYNATEPISTYGKVIPADSPNYSPDGDYEPDGLANVRGKNSLPMKSREMGADAVKKTTSAEERTTSRRLET